MPVKSVYRIMRVRVRKNVYKNLVEIARKEGDSKQRRVSVADLVREAINDWLKKYYREKCEEKIHQLTTSEN